MNKKIFSFVGIGLTALALLFFAGFQTTQAATNVTFQGDLPEDAVNYVIRVYDEVNADPCPGTGALGSAVGVQGDATYNDNDDYSITGLTTADADASIYFCASAASGDLRLKYEDVAVVDSTAYYIDLGKIIGTTLHNDLDNDYVAVCSALGGTQLSSEDQQVDAGTNSYTQYYAIDCGAAGGSCPTETYVLFDNNNVAECTWDGDKSTGKKISIASAENYGVYLTFAPDTLNVGDLHADLDAAKFELYNSNSLSVGMAIETYTDAAAAPDGDGADDDYKIYYDKPASGDMWLTITSAANGSFSVYGIANAAFTAGYDFYLDVEDATGGIPDTVSHIRYAGLAGATDAVVYVQDPRVSGDVQLFDIYTDTGDATDDIEFYEDGSAVAIDGSITGGTKVYQKQINLSDTGDEAFDVGKVTGEMHSDVETGTDLVAVYSNNACSTLVSSETINPSNDGFNTTDDYEVYFEETGADYYLKMIEEAGATDYESCGNHFTLTNQAKADHNIVIQVSGTRHADMAAVLVDNDKGSTLSNGDVWTTSFLSNVYHIYTVSDATSQVVFDDTDATFAAILLTTVTEKDFSSDGVVDAAKVFGSDANIHADLLNDGGGATNDLIMVTVASANGTGVDLASIAGIIDASDDAATTTDTYICYFEVPSDGLVNVEIQDGDAANAVLAYVYNFIAAGAGNYTFEPFAKVTATFPATALGFEVQQGDSGGYNMRDNTSTFIVYVDKTEEAADNSYDYRAYTEAAFTNVVLDRSSKDVSEAATFEVNTVTNTAIHADVTGDTDPVDIYTTAGTTADCTTTLRSSDTVQVWAAGSKKYYETDTAKNLVLKITDGSYVSCVNTLIGAAAAGGDNVYSIDKKTSGNVNPDVITVYIDADQDASEDISQTAVVGTPSTYAILWAGDAASDISFYNVTPVLVLDRTGKNLSSSATVYVAKVSGNSQTALTTVDLYGNTDCSTGGTLNSKVVDPDTTYAQYFEGVDAGNYYTKVSDGTYTNCQSSALTVAIQAATAHFDRKLSGTIPDQDETDTDMLSATVDTGTITYWTNTVNGTGTNTYAAYVDSTDSAIATTAVVFKDTAGGAGTTLLTVNKDLSGDNTLDAGVVYGETHADIEGGANRVNAVCLAPNTTNATCATKYSTVATTAADNVGGLGHDYDIFYEWPSNTTVYLEVLDNDTVNYYSWNEFTSGTAGTDVNVELDGKLDGYVAEAWDTPTTRVPDVTIKMYPNSGDPDTNQISLTYSYTGTTTPGGNYRMYGNLTDTNDAQYAKTGYITQSAVDTGALSGTVNVDLVSGMKVTVSYEGAQKVTDATVSLYVCSGTAVSTCTSVLDTCTNPSGDCTITGDGTAGTGLNGEYYFGGMTTGTYVQVKVVRSGFNTIYDPDPASAATAYTISSSSALTPTFTLANPAPSSPTLVSPENGYVTIDSTPDLTWVDLGGDETSYEIQVDDNADFSSVHAGGGTTADGATNTWTVDTALTTDTQYYWRVRGCDAGNCGGWSEARNFYVNTGWNTMAAPTLTNTAGTSQVTVSWTALTGASHYKVYRKSSSPVANTDTFVGNSTGLSFADYAPDGTWYYAVEPIDGTNTAGTISTTSASVIIDTIPLDIVFLNIPIPNGYFTAATGTVSWHDINGETSYTVEVADNSAMTTNLVSGTGIAANSTSATVGASQTVDKILADGASYYWRVKAVDSAGPDSPWSEVRKFTVDATPPTALTVNNPGTTADSQSFLAKITSGEAGLTCKASFDTISWASMEYTMADNGDNSYQAMVVSNGEGAKQVKFECRDAAGNAVTTTKNVQVTYTYPAILKITAPANAGYVNNASPAVDIEAESAGLICKLNLTSNNPTWNDASWASLTNDADSTYSMAATAPLGGDGLKTIYFKCQRPDGPVPVDAVITTFTLDTAKATYTFGAMTNSINVKSGDEVEAYYTSDEDLASSPTATVGGEVATVTRSGRMIGISRVLDGTETDNNIVITGGADLAGNTANTLTDTNRITTDFVTPTLSTPSPADAATAQTSPVALSITAGGNETGLDCRYHFAPATTTADIAFGSMGYWMADNGDGTYGSYVYMPDGTWFVNIKCRDVAGNEGEFGDAAGAGYSFTVGTDPTTITVTGISATKSYALADGTYANGWAWVFDVTVPTAETSLKMKFADWVSGSNSIAVANNMRFYSSQAQTAVDQANAITITAANTYSAVMTLTGDRDTTKAGRQIQITVEAEVPAGSSAGSYSTSYGIQSL